MAKKCFTWSQLNQKWSTIKYKWSDVCILIKAAGGGSLLGGIKREHIPSAETVKNNLTKKEYKHFITLICMVNGISYKEIKERRDKGSIDVTLYEIKTLYEDAEMSIKLNGIIRENM